MTKQYYTDGVARVFYEDIKQSLAEWTSRQLDGYELSHVGVKRNNEFEESPEFVLTLHFNVVGKIKVPTDLNEYKNSNERLLK